MEARWVDQLPVEELVVPQDALDVELTLRPHAGNHQPIRLLGAIRHASIRAGKLFDSVGEIRVDLLAGALIDPVGGEYGSVCGPKPLPPGP